MRVVLIATSLIIDFDNWLFSIVVSYNQVKCFCLVIVLNLYKSGGDRNFYIRYEIKMYISS